MMSSLIDCSKNSENYFVMKVDGVVVEDYDGLDRPFWRCVEKNALSQDALRMLGTV